ncbi:L-ribulose-5-phosphate 3-epimerase [Mycoplasma testudineum]|uniref:L-ribulose-5-phosphate 3-epimerase n=1 Tax=Mycoplasma testudineum TaxID=244584 RepID=A0A4R6IJF4_9MOLU|nr:L-ribulose-5-phosphate 3-epimerase [Mycoplasma testudineum]TDO22150.1 L-ribulose-5-phosphate 3-epimerase [Mycoplasma testudineum]
MINKVGIYEKAINNKFSIEQKIDIAKSAGYDFIEFSIDESDERFKRLDWDYEKLTSVKKILLDKNFEFNSMTLSTHRKYPFGSNDKKIRDKAKYIIENAIRVAKVLGIKIIQLATYDIYYENPHPDSLKYFLQGIKYASELAKKESIILAFETMDTHFGSTVTRCLNIIKSVNNPPFLYVYPDLGNLNQFSNDVETEIKYGANHIVAYHVKDTKPGIFRDIEFGQGTVDFVKSFKIIQETKFTGPFLIEMWSKNNENETLSEAINKIKSAKQFFLDKWNEAKSA